LDTDQTRRLFLGQAGASLGLLWLSSLTPELLAQAHAHAQSAQTSGAKPYRFFTAQQAAHLCLHFFNRARRDQHDHRRGAGNH